MINLNLNANTTCITLRLHNLTIYVIVNCVILSKLTEELFLINLLIVANHLTIFYHIAWQLKFVISYVRIV